MPNVLKKDKQIGRLLACSGSNRMPKAKKRGRPPLPKGHVKGKIVPVRLNDEEVKLFTKAADKSEHESLSSWIRHVLRQAAEARS